MSTSPEWSLRSQSIVKTLLYFDIFSYPLKKEEIFRHLQSNHISETEVGNELQRLSKASVLFQSGEFYCMHHNEALIERRVAGNKKAMEYLKIAKKRARWIYRFPFVRAVMISGSLSKNFADEHTDIDFFIVTAPGRLWVARTLLVLFKRIFLLNSHKYFCVNYFVDEDHLEIEEKNLFTATELMTLVPLHGFALYDGLINANAWVRDMLPNAQKKEDASRPGIDSHLPVKRLLEMLMRSGPGDWLEKFFMQLSKKRWRLRYRSKLSAADFEVAFKSKEYVSKNHPDNYQRKVMERYRLKLEEFALRHTWKWVYD